MSSRQGIKVFCRVKPSKRACAFLNVNTEHNQIEYDIPVDLAPGIVNNTKTSHKFKFDGLFQMNSTQDDIFTRVAKPACDNTLEGYNATIFAYGQTGSGKTFTITGGAERYQDRGIIPRALTYMFTEFKKRSDMQFNVYVSYLEIYNDAGYDLLDPSHETKTLEELPRVTLMEDDMGNVHLKNLSVHHAVNDEEALNLLFMGDTNRAISETPMNMASSRSHCIFTVSVESRLVGSSTVRRSKLHLVDLAGSERVHKTHATGQLLREASHINQSLHYLELVITTLADKKSPAFVPYRNSMMTSVLRDSLGGNCKTVMIATMNPEEEQIGESISTCRFSQRVASVKNSAIVNEETDPLLVIRRLKTEVAALKAEVAFLKGEQGEDTTLTEDEDAGLCAAVKLWVTAADESTPLDIGAFTATRINRAFRVLRVMAKEGGGTASGAGAGAGSGGGAAPAAAGGSGAGAPAPAPSIRDDHPMVSDVKQLRAQLQQRDNEIAILVNMVKQAGAGGARPLSGLTSPPASFAPRPALGPGANPAASMYLAAYPPSASSGASAGAWAAAAGPAPAPIAGVSSVGGMLAMGDFIDPAVLADKDRAMDVFMASYPKAQAIQDNKLLLRERYASAKALAEQVNGFRDAITRHKQAIEAVRRERAVLCVSGLADASPDAAAAAVAAMPPDEHELALKAEMDTAKKGYHETFQTLRDTKSEIERVQRVFEAGKLRMHADFDSWLTNSLLRSRHGPASASGGPSYAYAPAPAPAAGFAYPPASSTPSALPPVTMRSQAPPAHTLQFEPLVTPVTAAHAHTPAPALGYSRTFQSMPSLPQPQGYPAPSRSPVGAAVPVHASAPTTGSSTADADIAAFYAAREAMLKRGGLK